MNRKTKNYEREEKRIKEGSLKEFAKLTYALAMDAEGKCDPRCHHGWAIDPYPGEENPYLWRVTIKKEEK